MAVIITNGGSIPVGQFEINSKRRPSVYLANTMGTNNIAIYNVFDTRQQLLTSTNYTEFTVNGVAYGTRAEVLTALIPVLFTPIEGAGATVAFGAISGAVADQANLQAALDLKMDIGAFAAWADITSKPTTILGFGITDAYTKAETDAAYAATSHTHTTTDITNLSSYTGFDSRYLGISAKAADSELLDGVNGANYARSNTADTISGIHTHTARPAFNGGTSGASSPFTVDSTTVVTNLNADSVRGYISSVSEGVQTIARRDNDGYIKSAGFKSGNFIITANGTSLEFYYNTTLLATLSSTGVLDVTSNVTAG